MALTTALIRAHLNLEPDDDRDEDLLTHYANVAQAWVSAYTGAAYDDAQPLMVQAALLLVAHQYESREGVTFASPYQLPFGVHDLLSPLKERVTGHTSDPRGGMMGDYLDGQAALDRKLRAIRDQLPEALRPLLIKAGNEIAADARTLAESSRLTGALIESVHVTGPGQTTPPHSTSGGQRTAGEFEVLVTAGDTDARHAHLVEGGTTERFHKDGTPTGTMPAQPFFNPAWRLNRDRLQRRVNAALRRAFKKAMQQ